MPGEMGLASITARLDLALLARCPRRSRVLLQRLDAAAATSHDISELLDAVPSLAKISRYGDVRATDAEAVGTFVSRIRVAHPRRARGGGERD